jgi:putative SOS response-associated peptidase YedK
MCARYTLATPASTLARLFDVDVLVDLIPRYNIAPSQLIPAVRLNMQNERELVMFRWGLIPSWASDPSLGNKHLNARAETVGERPSFREAIRHRRCIIPADGFYEWQETESGKKQPFLIRRSRPGTMAFAGIWDCWVGPDDRMIESCSILTTNANKLLKPLHDRMPVILEPSEYFRWMDRDITGIEQLQPMMRTLPDDEVSFFPVSMKVNNARFDDPVCVEPLPDEPSVKQLTLW